MITLPHCIHRYFHCGHFLSIGSWRAVVGVAILSCMANDSLQEEPDQKDARYPTYGLGTALKVARAVEELGGGRAEVSKSLLASHLGKEDNPGFTQLVGAAKAYRMLQGRTSYRLTHLGHRLCRPEGPDEFSHACIEALESPLAFRVLIERFDGKRLPNVDTLVNILVRGGHAPESWAGRVAAFFSAGAKEIGVLDDEGILRVGARRAALVGGASLNTEIAGSRDEESQSLRQARNAADISSAKQNSTERQPANSQQAGQAPTMTVWTLPSTNGAIRVETPNPLPRALWERLKRYVESQEPLEEEDRP